MRQLAKDALLIILMFGSSLMFGNALALEPLPAPVDNEKMAADSTDDTSDAGDTGTHKKSHKSKEKNKNDNDNGDGTDNKDADDSSAKKDSDIAANLDMQGDTRIKMLLYDESDVYTITTRYGYQTNIVFSSQEEIELISVGDRSLWQIIPSGHRMFIRPMEEDVVTNMTVLTNKHSYQFDLKSLPASGKSGNIYVAQFVYGTPKKPSVAKDTLLPAATPAATPMPASSPFGVGPSVPVYQASTAVPPTSPQLPPQPTPLVQLTPSAQQPIYPNYSYTYTGPDDLAPLQVYDDGRSTYLKYNNIGKLSPSAFIVDPSGKENPVSYSVKGDYIVIDTVTGELALKNNGNVVYVFNEMLNPG